MYGNSKSMAQIMQNYFVHGMLLICVVLFVCKTLFLFQPSYQLQFKFKNLVFFTPNKLATWRMTLGLPDTNTSAAGNTKTARLLTWFTTFKNVAVRQQIQLNTLTNWAKLASCCNVQPVLFSTNTTRQYDVIARDAGWHVYDVPRVNDYGTPYIGDMVKFTMNVSTATANQKSDFYGYANGDILFDEGLVRTLTSIKQRKTSLPAGRAVLIVGQRTNYKVEAEWAEPALGFSHISDMKREGGHLFPPLGMDYFFFTPDFFRTRIFDMNLVIGRPYCDNVVMATAKRLKVSVIDATKTIVALHQQSNNETQYAGRYNVDARFNQNVVGKSFAFGLGRTTLAQYETMYGATTDDILIKYRSTNTIVAK
jgi:hypothetical protein